MNVKKIIEINGDYTCKFGGEISHGYGNIRIFYGNIYAYEKKGVYKVRIYNENEYGRIYSPHGDYSYVIKGGNIYLIYPDGDIVKINDGEEVFPYGWNDDKKKKLREILKSLRN